MAFDPKSYLENLNTCLKELGSYPAIKITFTEQERIVDLFRLWYIDCREQEIVAEAKQMDDKDRWGLGDMLDD